MARAATVMCTYLVRPDREPEFRDLISRHWAVLREQGLATDTAPLRFRGEDAAQRPFFVEIFEWVSAEAPETAHHAPAVMAIWEPMGMCCEARDGRPAMEFPHVERLG